jgi:putative two-component system response regulator
MDIKARVLIVDDNKINVELIRNQLKNLPYILHTAYDGEEAIEKIKKNPPDLVLLDLMMPKLSGFEVCRWIKENPDTQFIPVIVITALQELDDKLKAIELGADDFLVKPVNRLELITRIKSLLRLKFLYDDLDTSENILVSLALALESKDNYTRGHSERVADFAIALGKASGLNNQQIATLRKGALLHDIGKIGMKESILLKPGKLTPSEMEHVRSHPARGHEICAPLKSLEPCLEIIRWHHERWDGTGYPDGLKGVDIPFMARITAIADTFDAMTTDRPYRKGMDIQQARDIMEKEKDSGQWDPELIPTFIKLIDDGIIEKEETKQEE